MQFMDVMMTYEQSRKSDIFMQCSKILSNVKNIILTLKLFIH